MESYSYDDPDFFLHEKWRLTKTDYQDYTLEEESPYLSKSSSVRAPHRSSSPPANLRRSSSTRPQRRQSPPPSSSPTLMRSVSKKGSAFSRKCTSFAKEQKARFYIIKRCVSMLVRLRKHPDH